MSRPALPVLYMHELVTRARDVRDREPIERVPSRRAHFPFPVTRKGIDDPPHDADPPADTSTVSRLRWPPAGSRRLALVSRLCLSGPLPP